MLFVFLLLLSCASLLASELPKQFETFRRDNSRLTYYFNKPATDNQFPIVAFLQGSEAKSCYQYYDWFLGKELFVDKLHTAFLLIEKPGIYGLETIDMNEYLNRNTILQRLEDYQLVVEQLRKQEPDWNKKIIFIGFSEGGALAALLGGLISETSAVVILSGGGGITMREEMYTLAGCQNRSPNIVDKLRRYPFLWYLKLGFLAARLFPQSNYRFFGHPLKWWHTLLDIKPWEYLEKTKAPIFIAHGTADINCPVESADKLVEYLTNKKQAHVTYRRYDNHDHGFNDQNDENHVDDILYEIAQWLQEQAIVQACSK